MDKYRFADTDGARRFATQQLADLSFVIDGISKAWQSYDVDNDPSLLRGNREMLLDYLGAAYALGRGADFAVGVDAFTLHSPVRSARCQGGDGDLFLDMAIGLAVEHCALVDMVASLAAHNEVGTGGHQASPPQAAALRTLALIVRGKQWQAREQASALVTLCGGAPDGEFMSQYFRAWGRSACALLDNDRSRFEDCVRLADSVWHAQFEANLADAARGMPVEIGAAGFFDAGHLALLSLAESSMISGAAIPGRYVDLAWIRDVTQSRCAVPTAGGKEPL